MTASTTRRRCGRRPSASPWAGRAPTSPARPPTSCCSTTTSPPSSPPSSRAARPSPTSAASSPTTSPTTWPSWRRSWCGRCRAAGSRSPSACCRCSPSTSAPTSSRRWRSGPSRPAPHLLDRPADPPAPARPPPVRPGVRRARAGRGRRRAGRVRRGRSVAPGWRPGDAFPEGDAAAGGVGCGVHRRGARARWPTPSPAGARSARCGGSGGPRTASCSRRWSPSSRCCSASSTSRRSPTCSARPGRRRRGSPSRSWPSPRSSWPTPCRSGSSVEAGAADQRGVIVHRTGSELSPRMNMRVLHTGSPASSSPSSRARIAPNEELGLQAGEMGAEARVDAAAELQVLIGVVTVDHHSVGGRSPSARISVGRGESGDTARRRRGCRRRRRSWAGW